MSSVTENSLPDDSLSNVRNQYEDFVDECKTDEFLVFNNMIDSIYSMIVKTNFDTLKENAIRNYSEFEHHRLIEILIAKKSITKDDLEKIQNIYSCKLKNDNIGKKDSEDIVIEEYICNNSEDASFWFNKIFDFYIDNNNPMGEPLKEPYKLWQSNNRLIHIYTRAEMWRTDMDSINMAIMKSFVFSGVKDN